MSLEPLLRAARLLASLFFSVFGRWQPPPWTAALGRAARRSATAILRRKRLGAALAVALVAASAGGYFGYRGWKNRPKPHLVQVSAATPELTRIAPDARPHPLVLAFSEPAAPLSSIDKAVERGVAITPAIAGRWRWRNERELVFEPARDWPVGANLRVRLAESGLVAPHVRLERYEIAVATHPFSAAVAEASFYNDPTDPDLRKIVATIAFSHPVEPSSLEAHLRLRLVAADKREAERLLRFELTYDKLRSKAFVHSEPIAIPERDASVYVSVEPGVRAAAKGPPSVERREQRVRVPGLYNHFRITEAEARVVDNPRMEPEQVLVLGSSLGVNEQELNRAIEAWLLPRHDPDDPSRPRRPYRWADPERVSEKLLSRAPRVRLTRLPSTKEYETVQSFRFDAPAGRYLYVRVKRGVRAFGGYILGETYQTILQVPAYPRTLKLLHEGALLALSGARKIGLVARDVPAVRVEVARFLPRQIHHLVRQSGGTFANPAFYGDLRAEDLSESWQEWRAPRGERGKPVYETLDLSPYLGRTGALRGLFRVSIESWDAAHQRALGERDTRMLMLTDLGVYAKRAADGAQWVFVQSIASGAPVAGAKVELLGRNGTPLFTETTGPRGEAALPAARGLRPEQEPTVYLVTHGQDASILPFERSDRLLDTSRFDVGGVGESARGEDLSAYVFSDRGVYRPGETVRAAFIVRQANWGSGFSGLPLVATVTDPRGLEIKRVPLKLDESGLDAVSFATHAASPTGSYTIALYTSRDGRQDGYLGSTSVQVREFLPDQMSLSVQLSAHSQAGWIHPKDLRALVRLNMLFGAPAAGRRIVGRLRLTPGLPRLSRHHRGYRFHDPSQDHSLRELEVPLEETRTDDAGRAELPLKLEGVAKSSYDLSLTLEAFDAASGRSVLAETAAAVSPLDYLIGWKSERALDYLDLNAPQKVHLIAVGRTGERVALSGLSAQVLRKNYVSALFRQPDGTYRYQSVPKEVPIGEKALAIARDGAYFAIPTNEAGDFALVLRDRRGETRQRIDFSVAGSADLSGALNRQRELELALARSSVAPGDELEISIKAPFAGTGLITVERDRVYAFKWFRADTTASVQTIRLPAALELGGYVSVALVRAASSADVLTNPLSHGIVPFSISRAQRTLALELEAPEQARPGETLALRLSANKSGRALVWAVDEGILRVAAYRAPDPIDHFFRKRALGVQTSQSLDLILPEVQQIVQALAPGGGEGTSALGANLNPFKRRSEQPAVYWSGVIDVDTNTRELRYRIPDSFNGSLRVMAVAATRDLLGATSRSTLSRGDFVLMPQVPQFVAPGDVFEVSVAVTNNVAGSGERARVSLTLTPSAQLRALDGTERTLSIGELREASASFRLEAKPKLGAAKLTFRARLGAKQATRELELSVRPAAPALTTLTVGYLKQGEKRVPVPRQLYPQHRRLEAGISPVPLTLAYGLKNYLEAFPHGCTEQLTSQAIPAVVLHGQSGSTAERAKAQRAARRFIDALWARQNAEGGFGQWTANPKAARLPSIYALHVLTEARERGFSVPEPLLARGASYLQALARATPADLDEARERAYAIYVLTRRGMVTTRYANAARAHLEANHAKTWRSDRAAAYLGATYRLLERQDAAHALIDAQRFGAVHEANYARYVDPLAADGQLLYLLGRHFPDHLGRVTQADLERLTEVVSAGRYNTYSSGWLILGLESYAKAAGKPASACGLREVVAQREQPLTLPPGAFALTPFSGEASALVFSHCAAQGGFYLLSQHGFDRAPATKTIAQKLEVFREYLDRGGAPKTEVRLGEELRVRLRLRALGEAREQLAVVDALPGGFEVVIQPPAGAGSADEGGEATSSALPIALAGTTFSPEYGDVRADRVVLYGSAGTDVQTFVYALKATNAGTFAVPPVQATSLYDRSVVARGTSDRLTVRP